MKFNERITLIKAGYTKQEIAEMEKESVEETQFSVSSKSDDRLNIIAESIKKLNERIDNINIINSVDQDDKGGDQDDKGGDQGTDQTNIFDELRNMIEKNPMEDKK